VIVVFDTNIIISAYIYGGTPLAVLEAVAKNQITLCSSDYILNEIKNVLNRPKFNLSQTERNNIIKSFLRLSQFVRPTQKLKVQIRDDTDISILECALAAKADYIVSGDRDLLDLGAIHGIPIVSAKKFLSHSLKLTPPVTNSCPIWSPR